MSAQRYDEKAAYPAFIQGGLLTMSSYQFEYYGGVSASFDDKRTLCLLEKRLMTGLSECGNRLHGRYAELSRRPFLGLSNAQLGIEYYLMMRDDGGGTRRHMPVMTPHKEGPTSNDRIEEEAAVVCAAADGDDVVEVEGGRAGHEVGAVWPGEEAGAVVDAELAPRGVVAVRAVDPVARPRETERVVVEVEPRLGDEGAGFGEVREAVEDAEGARGGGAVVAAEVVAPRASPAEVVAHDGVASHALRHRHVADCHVLARPVRRRRQRKRSRRSFHHLLLLLSRRCST